MANKCYIKKNGSWTAFTPYKKVNGQWQRCPVYRKENGSWVRIDQQLVTKTTTVSGYADWCGSFRNSSGTGSASFSKDDVYQGKYSSYYYLGVMRFTELFTKAKAIGTITKATLKLKNNHAYYNGGLKTHICGAWAMPFSRPSSYSFSSTGSTAYASNISFAKNGSEHKAITLNSTAISDIQNGRIDGFKVLSPTGFDLNNYGYFDGTSSSRPWLELTVQYQVWE